MNISRAIACASFLLFASIPVLAAGNGLKGEYFNNTGLTGSPAVTRTDATVNFEWWGTPAAGISNNYFSARWSGKVEAPVTGAYKLATYSNEAVRVWLNGSLIIDNWADHWTAKNTSAAINLTVGQQYTLKVDYREGLGMAVAKLLWSYPGQTETVIPQARLYSDALATGPEPIYLSELTPAVAQNGWGPYEKDRSNGESRSRDGRTIELNDLKWGRGLGVHAASDLRYQLMGRYKSFFADLGIDDEVGARGTVIFEVWLDGTRKYVSPIIKGADPVVPIALDVTGVTELKLKVLDAGDGISYDHADWAGARVSTAVLPSSTPPPNPNPTPTPQLPGTPTGLSATPGSGKITLTWNSVSGADSYMVYRGSSSASMALFAPGVILTNFIDLNTPNGTMFYYRVAAVAGSTVGQQSTPVNAMAQAAPIPTPVPAIPTGLAATPGNGQVSLLWSAVSGATGYKVFRSTSSSLPGEQIASGLTSTSFLSTGLTNGTPYFFRVAASNAGGNSDPSPPVPATPVAPPAPPPPPAVPTGLAAIPGNAQVALSWTAVSGATGYSLYRSTTAGAQGDLIMTLAGTSFNNTSLTNGTMYYYRVASSNANGSSVPSAQVSAKPVAPPVPPAPIGLGATAGNAEVTLTWTGSDAATTYNVYRGTVSGAQAATPIMTGITGLTFKDTGLTNNTTYYYKVAGVNTNGPSAMSNQASAKPVAPPAPPAPTGLAATAGNTEVTLNWVASDGAVSYNVYRGTASGAQGATPIMTGITLLTFKDTGLVNNTTYYYKVAAVNTNGTSTMSNQASAKPVPPPPPGAPAGFSASAGNAQVTLNWGAVTGALSYNIYRGTRTGGQGDVPLMTGITTLTFLDTAVTNGATYFYKVAAVSGSGLGTKSVEVSAVPTPPATVLTPEQMSAFKFLRQSTWGPTPALVNHVVQVGKSAFLDEQFALPATPYPEALVTMPNMELVSEQFFQNALQGQDQLRQRVAWALSQIWVASAIKVDNTHAMVPYIRVLEENAFGNVRDVLEKVTLTPAMGEFLDMVNNKKASGVAPNIVMPNENYARELIQLFTLGLTVLNPDGSTTGAPTYGQADILEMARVLTGWTYGDAIAGDPTRINSRYYDGPMEPVANFHDLGSKTVLGATFAANQTARQDLAQALDLLFNHRNIAPFISKQLIQRLVKSNPSPQYISDISAVFANNGLGVRGDLKAIVKAILLHPEASATPNSGKFSEPALFLTTLARGLNSTVIDHPYMTDFSQDMSQRIWFAPSVFNYFSPGYRTPGGVTGPELQIWSTATAMTRTNFVAALVSGGFGSNFTIDTTPYVPVAGNPAALVDTANANLMGGTMGPEMRQAILTALASSTSNTDRIRTVLYLIGSSMQYQVEH
ncbi:MAG: DUF1800 family protein [Bryobacteraceae bacterium]